MGIDPTEYYGDDAYGHSHINGVQESWRAARQARAELIAAQSAEAEAMNNILNPPVFEPRS
jgi:predicted GNAT superfamily acetyltransferase